MHVIAGQPDVQRPTGGSAGALHPDDLVDRGTLVPPQSAHFLLGMAQVIFGRQGKSSQIVPFFKIIRSNAGIVEFFFIKRRFCVYISQLLSQRFGLQGFEFLGTDGRHFFVPVSAVIHFRSPFSYQPVFLSGIFSAVDGSPVRAVSMAASRRSRYGGCNLYLRPWRKRP